MLARRWWSTSPSPSQIPPTKRRSSPQLNPAVSGCRRCRRAAAGRGCSSGVSRRSRCGNRSQRRGSPLPTCAARRPRASPTSPWRSFARIRRTTRALGEDDEKKVARRSWAFVFEMTCVCTAVAVGSERRKGVTLGLHAFRKRTTGMCGRACLDRGASTFVSTSVGRTRTRSSMCIFGKGRMKVKGRTSHDRQLL